MNKKMVNDVKYVFDVKSSNNEFNCVKCTFNYDGKTYAKDIMLVKEKGKDNDYYLNEAKEKFEKQINNKKFLHKAVNLNKEANNSLAKATKPHFKLKWPAIVGICGGGAALLAGTGVGFYFLGKAAVPTSNMCVVKFDTGTTGGTFSDGKTNISLNVKKGTKFSDAKNAASIPTLKYHEFENWYVNDKVVNNDYVINKDLTVTAKFESLKCKVSFYAAGNGNGTLTDPTAPSLLSHRTFDFAQGLTLFDVLNSQTIKALKPAIHSSATGAKASFNGWSIDGYSVVDEATQKATILEDSHLTVIAIYEGNVGDTVPRLSATFYSGDDAGTNQSGSWAFENNESTELTLAMKIDSTNGTSLRDILNSGDYSDPIGNYAGFDFWYNSTDTTSKKKIDYDEKFTVRKDFSLCALYTNHFTSWKDDEGNTREQDPWRAVINNANNGINSLHAAYSNDLGKGGFANKLVGLTRTIKMEDESEYNVTVIGEENDYGFAYYYESEEEGMYDLDFSDKLPLTFQFETPIQLDFNYFNDTSSNFRGWAYNYLISKSSPVREHLNNTFLSNFPKELRNNISSCQKYYQTYYDGSIHYNFVSEDKISIPSIKEVDYNNEYDFVLNNNGFNLGYDYIVKYDYYNNNKYLGMDGTTNKNIWVRTTGNNWQGNFNFYINPTIANNHFDKVDIDNEGPDPMCVQPTFCLGHQNYDSK